MYLSSSLIITSSKLVLCFSRNSCSCLMLSANAVKSLVLIFSLLYWPICRSINPAGVSSLLPGINFVMLHVTVKNSSSVFPLLVHLHFLLTILAFGINFLLVGRSCASNSSFFFAIRYRELIAKSSFWRFI